MQGLPASYIQVNLNLVLGTRSEKRNLVHAQHSSGIWYCAQGLKKGTWYMHSSTHVAPEPGTTPTPANGADGSAAPSGPDTAPEPGTVSGAGDAEVGVAPEPGTTPTPAYGTTPTPSRA